MFAARRRPRSRKYVAKKLMQSAKKGKVTREGLRHVPAAHFLTCRDSIGLVAGLKIMASKKALP